MASQRGGYRRPSNPAPASGPGQLSRRTDGGPQQTTVPMTGMAYGENADYNDIQSSAPLAAAPSVSNTRARRNSPTGPTAAATPLFSPTRRPEEPVTAGVNFGPGPGASPSLSQYRKLSDVLDQAAAGNPDSDAAMMATLARRLGY